MRFARRPFWHRAVIPTLLVAAILVVTSATLALFYRETGFPFQSAVSGQQPSPATPAIVFGAEAWRVFAIIWQIGARPACILRICLAYQHGVSWPPREHGFGCGAVFFSAVSNRVMLIIGGDRPATRTPLTKV